MSLDPVNRTAGNDDYVLLNNIDPGSVNRRELHRAGIADHRGGGAGGDQRGATIPVPGTLYPANAAGVAIPPTCRATS